MTRAKDISKIVTDADLSGTLDVTGTVTAGNVSISDDNNYSFGDGTTYIQGSGAADRLKFITNASEAVRIDSSGNVGIGTSSPSTTLHLDSGGTPTTIQIDSDTEASIDFNDHGGSAKRYKIGTNISSNDGQLEFKDMTANAERMRIDSSGNVGIGTSSPNSRLTSASTDGSTGLSIHRTFSGNVSGETTIGGLDFTLTDTATSNQVVSRISPVGSAGTGDAFAGSMRFFTAGTSGSIAEAMRIDSSGNVGIGTSSPSAKLEVSGASNSTATFIKPQGALPDNNDNAGLYVLHQGTAGTGLRVRTDNALTGSNFAHILVNNASASINAFQVSQYGSGLIAKFDKSGTTAMQIDNSGHVTKPLQPAFMVHPSTAQSNIPVNGLTTIVFGTERFDQNGDFASNTFTAPVTGKYQLQVSMRLDSLDTDNNNIQLHITTSNKNYYSIIQPAVFASDPGFWWLGVTVLADMDASDTAYVRLYISNDGAAQMDVQTDSYFSGYLVA